MSAHAATAPETKLSINVSTLASVFFGVGLGLILLESVFFREVAALAHSPYGPRAIIGFHLFFSEIWFIFVGNAMLALMLIKRDFKFERDLLGNCAPVAIIFVVYALWFVYGSLAGNDWALEEFREMVFNGLAVPPVLYFAARTDAAVAFRGLIYIVLPVSLVGSVFGAHKTVLMIGTMTVAYFTFQLLYGRKTAIAGLTLAMLPFIVQFEKPMIALLTFTLLITAFLAGHLNPASRNWILSKFKLRIAGIAMLLAIAAIGLGIIVNSLAGGLIEDIIRYHFLKIRLSDVGEIRQGDLSGGRIAIWEAALVDWQNRFFFGHGLGASVRAFSSGWVTKVQYHNYFVQALHNTGLVGVTLIIGAGVLWVRRVVRHVFRVQDPGVKLVLACMLVYVINILFYGLYGHSLSFPPTAQLFWVAVGVLCLVPKGLGAR